MDDIDRLEGYMIPTLQEIYTTHSKKLKGIIALSDNVKRQCRRPDNEALLPSLFSDLVSFQAKIYLP